MDLSGAHDLRVENPDLAVSGCQIAGPTAKDSQVPLTALFDTERRQEALRRTARGPGQRQFRSQEYNLHFRSSERNVSRLLNRSSWGSGEYILA